MIDEAYDMASAMDSDSAKRAASLLRGLADNVRALDEYLRKLHAAMANAGIYQIDIDRPLMWLGTHTEVSPPRPPTETQ